MADAPSPELDGVLVLMQWRKTGMGADVAFDKKAMKAGFGRAALLNCIKFLSDAPNEWLQDSFRARLGDKFGAAMGQDDEQEKLGYLSQPVVAELMRAAGIGP